MKRKSVHYRIGSLEMSLDNVTLKTLVHYRIGSLETPCPSLPPSAKVHYRIGSLETNGVAFFCENVCSLPYR